MTKPVKTKMHSMRGFTLIELAVVVFIIGLVMAVAAPRLLPTLIFSAHRAAAHQLGDYGRAVLAKAALSGDKFTMHIDLTKQQYWTVQWVQPEPEEDEDKEKEKDPDYLSELDSMRHDGLGSSDLAKMIDDKRNGSNSDLSGVDSKFLERFKQIDLEKAQLQYDDKFFKFAMRRTLTRMENVKQEEDLTGGSIFADKASPDEKEKEPIPVELKDNILQRTQMPDGIRITDIVVEGKRTDRGEIEINISPLGLSDKVWFHVINEEGAYFTVFWNPLNNSSAVFDGQQDFY